MEQDYDRIGAIIEQLNRIEAKLDAAEEIELLNYAQLSDLTGYAEPTLRQKKMDGTIPKDCIKTFDGGHPRFVKSKILAWLNKT